MTARPHWGDGVAVAELCTDGAEVTEHRSLHGPSQDLLRALSMQICHRDESRRDSSLFLVASTPLDGTGVHPERRLVNHWGDTGNHFDGLF